MGAADLARQQARSAAARSQRPSAPVAGADAARRQAQAAAGRTAPATNEEQGSGVLHELSNIKDMALAVPGGLFGLGRDAVETAYNVGRIPGAALTKTVGNAAGISDEELAGRIRNTTGASLFLSPEMIEGVQADPQAEEGLGKTLGPWSGEFSATAHELFPLFGGIGASANKTGGRVVDAAAAGNPFGMLADAAQGENPLEDLGDTEYSRLWQSGELAPAALEDIANLSLVAAGGGAVAGRTAGRAGTRAAALADDVAAAGANATPELIAAADRAASRAATLGSLEQGLNKAAHLTGRGGDLPATMWKAPGLIGETMGGRFGLFTKGRPAASMSERLIPFGREGTRTGLVGYMGDRGLGSLVQNLDRTTRGAAVVDWWDEHPMEAARKVRQRMTVNQQIRDFENSMTDAQSGVARRGVLAERAEKVAARKLGADLDDVTRVPTIMATKGANSLMDLFDDPNRVAYVTDVLFDEGLIPVADPVVAREYLIEAAVGPENVTAFKIADQYRRGQMDPDASMWLERSNTQMRPNKEERQARFLADEGARTAPQPENIVRHQEQLLNEPMPSVVEGIIEPARQRREQIAEQQAKAAKELAEAEQRLLIPEQEYRAPLSQQDLGANVPETALRPAERAAGRQGAAEYAEGRSQSLFARPPVETATPGEFAQGVRGEMGARQALNARRRTLRGAQEGAEAAMADVSTGAVPQREGLFQGGAAPRRASRSVEERAQASVEAVMGPAPTTKKARQQAAGAALDEVKGRIRERLELDEADLAAEADQKFGYDALPELPFIPPPRPDGTPTAEGTPDFWLSLTPEARRDFEGRYMAPETLDQRRIRAAKNEVWRRRHNENFYEDGDALHRLHQSTPKALRPALVGDQGDFANVQYRDAQTYLNLEQRHARGAGVAASELGASDLGAANIGGDWVSDWTRIADEQTLLGEKKRAITGEARGQNRENVNIEIDQLDPEDFVLREEIGPGVEAETLTAREVEAVLKGFDDETGRPLTASQRRDMMADALDEKRQKLTEANAESLTAQLEEAFTSDLAPWEWDRADFVSTVETIRRGIAEAQIGDDVTDLVDGYAELVPAAFDADSIDAVYEQWVSEAENRGLRQPDATPDQMADRAVAGAISKVTDAFEADRGVRGAGFQALSPLERRMYRQMEAVGEAGSAAQVVAEQRQRVSELQGKMRAGIAEQTLRGEARSLQADADRIRPTDTQTAGARQRAIEHIARRVTKDQRRIAERQGVVGEYRKRLAKQDRRLLAADRRLAKVEAEAPLNPRATPAKFSEGTRARSKVAAELNDLAQKRDDPALRAIAEDVGRVDADTLYALMGDTEHVISSEVKQGTAMAKGRSSVRPYATEEGSRRLKSRTEGQTDYTTRGQTAVEARRVAEQTRNTAARAMHDFWGKTAAEAMGERRRFQRDLPDLNDLDGKQLAQQMRDEGWVAWDPTDIRGTVADANVNADTLFIPETVWKATEKMFNESSGFYKALETWYDRRFLGQVKMFWLALSPRWLNANIVGNMMMGTIGAGIDPATYATQVQNARALLAEEAPLEWQEGNRAQRRLFESRQKLVARGEDLRRQGFDVPPEVLNRGFTAEEIGFLRPDGVKDPKSPIRKLAQKSYEFNEYTDNVSRAAIYLSKMEPRRALIDDYMNNRITVDEFNAKIGDTRTVDQAVRLATRAAGDFSKLSAFEKQFVKRVWIFYPWYRHITKLAMSLPIYAPARTTWLLHLADVFGGDPNEERRAGAGSSHQAGLPKFAQGGIPMGDGSELSAGGLNPFAAGLDSPFYSAEGMLGATTPALQWPAAIALGKDMKHGMRDFSRSPGSGNLDEYGRPTGTPLWQRPDELANYMTSQFPQGRLFQTATREPQLYYDTGEPMLSGGQPIKVDKPSGLSGAAMGLFGVPSKMSVEAEEIAGRKAKREREAAKKQARYRSQREAADA